ncbi:MAG: multiubiquitin domain-containing protein [Halobacteriota archaeon]
MNTNNEHQDQAPGQNKSITIIVNGRPREVTDHKLTYLQVVQLAFPDEQPSAGVVYTVTFSNPHGKDGSLVDGQEEVVKDGMIFNVRKTDQS